MATEHPTTPTRRSALRGFGIAAIAAGLAVPAQAATTSDAELIRACGEVMALKDRFDALFRLRRSVEDEHRTESDLSALYDKRDELLDLIDAAGPPTTLDGARAMAGAAVAIAERDADGEIAYQWDHEWLAWSAVEFWARSATP